MKKLVILAAVAIGLYYGWMHFGPSRAVPVSSQHTTPAANATQRIDSLSGAAPSE